ncbi:hypothetical protein [Antarctobacter sp.]|uniref:hypothetical protein n=1 Tax=Antarctobacter sp. TaxID=1872577 RepID=UPI002B268964|nr:hypothetical protein [Antarctobacter sp.]
MRKTWIAACACAAFAAACAQTEQNEIVVVPQFDKYGNVVNGTIVDGYLIGDDGTVIGPVSPDVAAGNQVRTRERTQAQQQVQTQQQVQQQQGGN